MIGEICFKFYEDISNEKKFWNNNSGLIDRLTDYQPPNSFRITMKNCYGLFQEIVKNG